MCRNTFTGLLFVLITSAYSQNHWIFLDSPATVNLNKLHFINNQTGWVAGDSGLIMKTADGGVNWTQQTTNTDNHIVEIFMLEGNHGWALGIQLPGANNPQYGTNILRTSNGGAAWSKYLFPNEFFLAVFFLDSLRGWMGGSAGKLVGTTDGGASWFPANVDSTVFSGFTIREIKFLTPQYGYAVGGHIDIAGVIWRTDDGGQFWTVQGVGPEPILDLHFIDSLNIISVSGDWDFGSGTVTTSDGGTNWQYTYLNIFGEANAIAFRTPAEAWSPLGFTGTLMFSQDSGKTWTDFYSPDSTPMYDVTFTDSATGYMVGDNGTILKYDPPTSVVGNDPVRLPTEPLLSPNYPNPFNSATTFEYHLSARAFVSLQIFDVRGKMVTSLVNGFCEAGVHKVKFEAADLSSGLYFYRLKAVSRNGNKYISDAAKMLLLK